MRDAHRSRGVRRAALVPQMSLLHPLLHKLATEPGLLLEHASGYAELASAEARLAAGILRRRVILLAAAVMLATCATLLGGMALLLWASLPAQGMPAPALLWGVPLSLLCACGLCVWGAGRGPVSPSFCHVREQWSQDMVLLRQLWDRP